MAAQAELLAGVADLPVRKAAPSVGRRGAVPTPQEAR